MGILEVWHPEIEDFITAKLIPNNLTKFNLSVGITEGFMEAVKNDLDWDLIFPDTSFKEYESWNGNIQEWKNNEFPVIVYKTLKARKLWDLIMESTYSRNDPGVIFLDLMNKLNPLNYCETIFTTNPCGEIGMATGVCDLGSLNLTQFVKIVNTESQFDFEEYSRCVKIAVRFLDNINSLSRTPLDHFAKSVTEKRRIGLGNMGVGSMHYMMKIRYGLPESIDLLQQIYKIKAESEIFASAQLGKEKGSFPLFDKEKYFNSYWWKNLNISSKVKQEIENIGEMRNSHHSMNAPTGNTGILANCVSGGIEPVFLESYVRWSIVTEHERRLLKEQGFNCPDALKGEWFETDNLKFTIKGKEQILKGTFRGVDYEVDKSRGLIKATIIKDYGVNWLEENFPTEIESLRKNGILVTTETLTVDNHIDTLKEIAHYTNMNNSKTTNVPNDYPYESFKTLYMTAWKNEIKGLTTYREGTSVTVLEKKEDTISRSAPKRPKKLKADVHIISLNKEKFIVAIGLLDDKPYEIFCGALGGLSFKFREHSGILEKIKRGHYKLEIGHDLEIDNFSEHCNTERAFFRMLSILLRHGVEIRFVVEQLMKSEENIGSLTVAAARVLKKYIKEGEVATGTNCISCGSDSIKYIEGCMTCTQCAWSKCL